MTSGFFCAKQNEFLISIYNNVYCLKFKVVTTACLTPSIIASLDIHLKFKVVTTYGLE